LGYEADEVVGTSKFWRELLHPDDREDNLIKINDHFEGKTETYIHEIRLRKKSGEYRHTLDRGRVFEWDEGGTPLRMIGTDTDITERRKTAEALKKTNRALTVLSQCNQAVGHAVAEQDLLDDVCEIIVKLGGYKMAWVGYTEHDENKTVRPISFAGQGKGYTEIVNIVWSDTERGQGPVGIAIRTGKPYVTRNIQTDPNFSLWREAAIERGYGSSTAIPLFIYERVFGAIMIYAPEAGAFDKEEMELLVKLADNLTYGIYTLRIDAERKQKEEEGIELEQQLAQSQKMEAIGQLTGGIAHDFNNILAAILGYSELAREMILEMDNDKLERYLNNIIKGGNRASKIVEEMLVFSRAGVVTAKVISVTDVVQDTINLLQGTLPSSMEIKVNIGNDIPPCPD